MPGQWALPAPYNQVIPPEGGTTPTPAPAPSNLTGTTPYEGSPWDFGPEPSNFGESVAGPGSPWDFDFGDAGGLFTKSGIMPMTGGYDYVQQPGGGGKSADTKPESGKPSGSGGGGLGGPITGGISPAQQQQQAGLKQQGLTNFMQMLKALGVNLGGGTAFQPVTPPNFMDLIRQAIDAAAKKQNLALSEEAAATGGAGGSVLAGFQGKVAEAQQGAYGQAAAGAGQQQFTAQLQAQALQAQQQIAQFNQLMKFIQAMGPFLGG